MVTDVRTIPDNHTLETDICIIGAGAAGITLAREFIGHPFRVSVLESRGFEFEAETQSLCDGKNIGLPYYPLHATCLRFFGGATNHWAGVCRPFNDYDFETREWIPYCGWPFGASELRPFYERVRDHH